MRCSKCGWPNRPNETNCTKCGAPLLRQAEDTGADTRIEHYDMSQAQKTVFEDKTVIQQPPCADRAHAAPGITQGAQTSQAQLQTQQAQAMAPQAQAMTPQAMAPQAQAQQAPQAQAMAPHAQGQDTRCPKCGYPMRQDASVCPNCKTVLHKSTADTSQADMRTVAYTPQATRQEPQKPSYGETVNPYLQEQHTAPSFSLTPIRRYNEQSAPGSNDYDGDEVLLTRSNTDRDNTSITSRTQAVVTHADGKWFIEDRSSQNTTFVQARHKIELHDGDTILLGDRLFTFHE